MPLVNHLITSQVTIISFYFLKGISAYTFPSFQKKKNRKKKGKKKRVDSSVQGRTLVEN